jgi:hypothetical protein
MALIACGILNRVPGAALRRFRSARKALRVRLEIAWPTCLAKKSTPIQEPGAFEFYHPNEDVLNGNAPSPEAALVSTTRTRDAYGAVDSCSLPADFNKSSVRRRIGTGTGRSWCLHDYVNDIVDCSYSNRSQCAATASGGLGECSMNR